MPHAKIDVAFIRDQLKNVEARRRAQAAGLYVALVSISGELLLDGEIPAAIVAAVGHELGLRGVTRRRDRPSEVATLCHQIAACGVIDWHQDGGVFLKLWREHHNAREYVEGRRKLDADRKRESRKQLTLGEEQAGFHSGSPPGVRSGQDADPRARARRRSASESEDPSSSSSTPRPPRPALPPAAPQPGDDDDQLEHDLEQLGVNGATLRDALRDPARARAWIAYTADNANGNPAGYFHVSFATGAWPPNSNGTTSTSPPIDPVQRRERWLRDHGWRFEDDLLLDTQLEDMGADNDERIGLLELAHDLRRQPNVST